MPALVRISTRAREEFNFNTLGFAGGNFFLARRHFLTGTAVKNDHFFSAQPEGGTGGIDGDITAADNDGFIANLNFLPQADIAQK